ncbi:hypothetical protein BH18CHL2_BH18CHL2_02000 [soil metagenome]
MVGVFRDRHQAEVAAQELRDSGFRNDQIGFAMKDEQGDGEQRANKVGEGGLKGALTGGALGTIIGAGAAALIPGIGPVLAGGILAGAVTGGAAGMALGGLAGSLAGMGVSEDDARYYEDEFKQGRVLLTVKADGRADEAKQILERAGAYDATRREAAMGAAGRAATARDDSRERRGERGDDGDRVELREEKLRADKETVEAGEVRVGKRVVTEQKQIEVPVTREEAVIERRPVGERPASGSVGSDDEVRVPLREEKVRIEKEPVVTEEVSVGKRQRQDTERVSETVQREEAEIEGSDEPEVRRG